MISGHTWILRIKGSSVESLAQPARSSTPAPIIRSRPAAVASRTSSRRLPSWRTRTGLYPRYLPYLTKNEDWYEHCDRDAYTNGDDRRGTNVGVTFGTHADHQAGGRRITPV